MTNYDPEIVAVLEHVDGDSLLAYPNLTMDGGRPATPEEVFLVGQAKQEDLAEMLLRSQERAVVAVTKHEAAQELAGLLTRYGMAPQGETVGDVLARMSDADRGRAEHLLMISADSHDDDGTPYLHLPPEQGRTHD